MSAASVSKRPVGQREARCIQFHDLDRQLGSVEGGDGAQPVDPDALSLGILRLLLLRRHLLTRPPVHDQGVVSAKPPGDPGRVHRRIASAVYRHAVSHRRPRARGDRAQERDRIDNPSRVPSGDIDTLREVSADRDEDGVEVPFGSFGLEVLNSMVARDEHTQVADAAHLRVKHVTWQPVCGNPVAHHPAGQSTRIADLNRMTAPGQVICRGETARAGADDQDSLASRRRGRRELPTLLEGFVTEETLDRVDRNRAVQLSPVAHDFAWVVAHASMNCWKRVVGDQFEPCVVVATCLGVSEPRLDVFPAGQPALHGGSRST